MLQGKPGSLDVEPDQELTAPGNTIFEELAGSDGPNVPAPAPSIAANKLSKGREGQSNARNSELYIGGLEDMKVCLTCIKNLDAYAEICNFVVV
jgi:hypothetical protein